MTRHRIPQICPIITPPPPTCWNCTHEVEEQDDASVTVLIDVGGDELKSTGQGVASACLYSHPWSLSGHQMGPPLLQDLSLQKQQRKASTFLLKYTQCIILCYKWTYLWNRNRILDTKNSLVVTKGNVVGGGMEWEVWVSRCKLLYLEWINNKVLLYSTENYIQYSMKNRNGK